MAKFRFVADTILEAEDLDVLLNNLSAHFMDIDNSDLEHEGIIEITPLEDTNHED